MTEDVSALIGRIAAGDGRAMPALSALVKEPLRRFGTGVLGNGADGEDLAQETLLKVWQSAGRFDPARGDGHVWLYAIARNVARDMLRRRRIRWLVGLGALDGDPEDATPGPETAVADREALALVRRRMQDLPDAQRMALTLSALGDLDNAQIAAILGRSTGAVEQLLFRARRTLRKELEDTLDG